MIEDEMLIEIVHICQETMILGFEHTQPCIYF